MQFYTIGEVIKEAIAKESPNYVPYAIHNGLYKDSLNYQDILIEYWQPYIEGQVTMEMAIENIAKQLLIRRKNADEPIKKAML